MICWRWQAFNKKKANERKQWLLQYAEGTYVDTSSGILNYSDFINKELILFSMADNFRSIPSMVRCHQKNKLKWVGLVGVGWGWLGLV